MKFAGTDVTMPLSERTIAASLQARKGDYQIALLIYHRGGAKVVPLTPHVPVIVGRSPPSDVQILDHSLSRQHVRVILSGNVVEIEDLHSTNGTLVRGERVSRATVKAGDEVTLGSVIVAVRALSRDHGGASGLVSPLAREVKPIAQSPATRAVFRAAGRLARSTIPVLLQGETGTGKEVVARTIHEQSDRRAGPMVCVNCGAIPQQLVESTLFGHERGAFTGATQQHKGVFEAADGGTVFLDEIGELPPAAQVALLRVLEEKRVTRVGASKEIEVDVRLIAATHRDLEAMCETGAFRLDLLYRLNAMTIVIPPLRERPEDIEPLALRFLEQASRANGCQLRGILPGALALLRNHTWPGNIRELRNVIERAVIVADSDAITDADLPERVRVAAPPAAPARGAARSDASAPARRPSETPAQPLGDLKARLQRYEAALIVQALRESGGNQTEAARRLGMPLRTLVHKLKALRLQGPSAPDASDAPDAPDADDDGSM